MEVSILFTLYLLFVYSNVFSTFLDELPDEVKGIEILNSSSGFGSSDPKLPATLTNQVGNKVLSFF
jgi:hypothetical protein